MKPSIILVGIVEDNYDYASKVAQLLQLSPDIYIAGIWREAAAALNDIPQLMPDVVLMDLQLPDLDGIECIRRLSGVATSIQYLVLSNCDDDDHVFEALKAGASGYLLKDEDHESLVRNIRELHAGGAPVSPLVAWKLVRYFNRRIPYAAEGNILTKREQEIVSLLAEGKMYKEVSVRLGIAMETTKKHIRNIYGKLEVQNKTEAVNKWRMFRNIA
jgi:NarL family two-component system response regulator LiaR